MNRKKKGKKEIVYRERHIMLVSVVSHQKDNIKITSRAYKPYSVPSGGTYVPPDLIDISPSIIRDLQFFT